MNQFLPVTMEEVNERYQGEVDFVLVTGDAYVDHPSFGTAIISRVLEKEGYRVAILPQPDYKSKEDFMRFGKPKLGFLVNSGNLDSMVNHYTVNKKKRSTDAFSPGGIAGKRPDRAVIVYTNRIREAYGQIPVIIGGLEASLRRLAHYDYWSDKVRRSVLVDAKADYLIFGMGELTVKEVARYLREGTPEKIKTLPGIVYQTKEISDIKNAVVLNSFEEVREEKRLYAKFTKDSFCEQNPYLGKPLVQHHIDRYVVQNPPMRPLSREELDEVYCLPYMRTYHPMYEKEGGVPAISEVKFSIISERGCFGGCNFCSLAFHQGRIVTSRSEASILAEARQITNEPDFKGYIHDVGGPTANFRFPACDNQLKVGACKNKQCLFPTPCKNLKADHREYLELLRKLRALPKVKKVFVRSGIRFDYLMADKNDTFFKELVEHHVSGQLKVAPEHSSNRVLHYMGKPNIEVFEGFMKKFYTLTKKAGKEQYLVPYLMSSHPGCEVKDAVELALFLRKHKMVPEQVQDFYPTPGTVSTAMYYTELDPFTGKKVYVAKSYQEKTMQRALLQTYKAENRDLVKKALEQTGMERFLPVLLPHYNKTAKEKQSNDFRRKTGITKNQGRTQNKSGRTGKKGDKRGADRYHRGR
ncbi:MAG: YgiQ family radical SAM protein [Clostridia bacterium]|nr:YgiQ family radical SAM protein [Clostridia bacterium]